jgi:hypothetical protein
MPYIEEKRKKVKEVGDKESLREYLTYFQKGRKIKQSLHYNFKIKFR